MVWWIEKIIPFFLSLRKMPKFETSPHPKIHFCKYVCKKSKEGSQTKGTFYQQNNSRKIIGRNPSMVIPLLANQDLTPILVQQLRHAGIAIFEPPTPASRSESRKTCRTIIEIGLSL